ncbi:MAG: polyprenyl synthetase family protein [Pseudomonadota bacterium]
MMDAKDRFRNLKEVFEPQILALANKVVESACPNGQTLHHLFSYHMSTGGKRLRALLPLLVGDALGTDPAFLIPFGAACEVLHNATLVHDDLQDGDRYRRGRETVWYRFGIPQAINLGDAMFYYTVLLAQKVDVPTELREAVTQRVLLQTLRVIDGQEREFQLKKKETPILEDYFLMVEGKTSGLFALPMAGAAQLCGAPAGLVCGLEDAARHMGVLFQIQDDVLDLYADKGRDMRGSDIAEGKRSALVVHALETCGSEDRKWLRHILDKQREETSAEDVKEVIALFARTGSLQNALAEIVQRRKRALNVKALEDYPRLKELVCGMCDLFLEPIRPMMAKESVEA